MSKVFISYRRDDSKYQAQRIYDALIKVLPRDDVFMDIGTIAPGADFVETLEGWVDKCELLLALIGAGWVDAADPRTGKRRLEDENDFVRIEVREALRRGIPVVPVILDGARMPEAGDLPADLSRLIRRQAEFVEFRTFDTDVARLIDRLGLTDPSKAGRPKPKPSPVIEELRSFKDFPEAPEMIWVPKGYFIMGSPPDELGRSKYEGPRHEVIIPQDFAIGRYPVTRNEFQAFIFGTGYAPRGGVYIWTGQEWALSPRNSWQKPGFDQDGSHPVVCVNSQDIDAYIEWLNRKVSSRVYRLPSEAEWEYACRAGTASPFWWGTAIMAAQANYNGNHIYQGGGEKGEYRQKTVPVHSFEPNPWGLYQMLGNVWERCQDRWNETSYREKPFTLNEAAGALMSGDSEHCVVRGGSWESEPARLRAAFRTRGSLKNRYSDRGFRVVRTLNP
jgi:formylglycine-generating enzyme required for sulfatase activity